MKLSEEFMGEAKFSEEQSRKAFDEKNDVLANHLSDTERKVTEAIVGRLDRRVWR
jgi:hypothetical protein